MASVWIEDENRFICDESGDPRHMVYCGACGKLSANGMPTPFCAYCGEPMEEEQRADDA